MKKPRCPARTGGVAKRRLTLEKMVARTTIISLSANAMPKQRLKFIGLCVWLVIQPYIALRGNEVSAPVKYVHTSLALDNLWSPQASDQLDALDDGHRG